MKFQAVNFPGPFLLLRIGTFGLMPPPERSNGILATGKVLPRDYQVAGLDANEDTFSFYGRSMNNPEWTRTAGLQVLPFHQELFRHCVCRVHAQQSHQRQERQYIL